MTFHDNSWQLWELWLLDLTHLKAFKYMYIYIYAPWLIQVHDHVKLTQEMETAGEILALK